ncbi:MAG TPA: hypothetical protein VG826_35315 [Pirellulales bacterium]|nr:hypothetical protein [Pirellulales bacterium]
MKMKNKMSPGLDKIVTGNSQALPFDQRVGPRLSEGFDRFVADWRRRDGVCSWARRLSTLRHTRGPVNLK